MNHVTRLPPVVGSIGPQSFGTNYSMYVYNGFIYGYHAETPWMDQCLVQFSLSNILSVCFICVSTPYLRDWKTGYRIWLSHGTKNKISLLGKVKSFL
ncbi:hypothetical protein Hanom_Chr05g00465671 [Helianthus anomalus]